MTLEVERSDGVVVITLDRPRTKNALNDAMYDGLISVTGEIGKKPEVDRVVVVQGSDGAFCSGADLKDVPARDVAFLTRMRLVAAACLALHSLPQPTIAKVEGGAVGAGFGLALSCDLVVASETARFVPIFTRLGLSADFGLSWMLPRLVGPQRAKELIFLADEIGPERALALGIVNRVVPSSRLDAEVGDLARQLAAGPPLALSLSKQLLNQAFDVSLAQALEAEGQAQSVNVASDDAREVLRARRDGRAPEFHGR